MMETTQDETRRIGFFRALRTNGVDLGDERMRLLDGYVDLLTEWNAKINLISRKDTENVRESHLLHSLALLFFVEIPHGARLLDIGSGGGLPGIPLAIARPDLRVLLADSIQKKMTVVSDIVTRLGLANVTVHTGRVEELAKGTARAGGFDIAVARGVAPLADLIRWSKPLMRREVSAAAARGTEERGTRRHYPVPFLAAYKGGDLEGELRDAEVKCGRPPTAVIDLVFAGSAEAGWSNKKLIVVNL
jgi:16S rRNA (guanine527-N7)-methyltransferase